MSNADQYTGTAAGIAGIGFSSSLCFAYNYAAMECTSGMQSMGFLLPLALSLPGMAAGLAGTFHALNNNVFKTKTFIQGAILSGAILGYATIDNSPSNSWDRWGVGEGLSVCTYSVD